jgi:hypothetical protein
MKKAILVSLVILLVLIVLAPTQALAQRNYEVITVKGLEANNGVVILTVQEGSTGFRLQCNANVPGCDTLPPGSYVMVRLPNNWGTYVCANVEVYPTPVHPENLGEKLGDYCLVQK